MNIQLQNCASGRITIQDESGHWVPVNPCPCFPWSNKGTFISLRNDEGVELALVEDLFRLLPDDQEKIRNALDAGEFTFEITQIFEIQRDFELRVWKVDTNRGRRQLQTMLDDFPQILENGRIVITDLAGDIYEIRDRAALDKASLKMLWAFID
ncbi:MAG: DUF1854 domain-containing protein [Verrucomicrobiota bacterium]